MSADGKAVKLSDEELVSLIFGQRRLVTKLRGDVAYQERRGAPAGLIKDIGRQAVVARTLHSRLMDIARSRDLLIEVRTEPQQ